jgi:putative ABC transport system permease protein
VAVILAISITNLSTIESIKALFEEASGKAHLVITSSDTASQGFSESALGRVAGVAGVKAAVPALHLGTLLAEDAAPEQVDVSFFGAIADQLLLYGIDPKLDSQAREYTVVEGQFLSPKLDARDVVLVRDYAEERDLEVGHDITILTPEGFEAVRIVGLMSGDGAGRLNNGSFGVIPLRAAQELSSRAGDLDQIDIVATPEFAAGAELDRLKSDLQSRLGEDYTVVYPASQGKRVTQMLDVYQVGLSFFSVIALFVGAFLIYNAFSMTVVERTREIGMLRTVGMTRRQVMTQILTQASLLGGVGSAFGVGVGVLLSRGLIGVMELVLAQEISEVQVPLNGLVASVAVGIFATLIAAALPAWQAGRISPVEAIRIRGRFREGWVVRRGWILGCALVGISVPMMYRNPFPPAIQEQLANAAVFTIFIGATLLIPATVGVWIGLARPVVRRIYGSEGELGSRNIRRAQSRTTLTVAALMIGVAMLLSIRAVTDAFKFDIRNWVDAYVGGDLYVHSSLPMRTAFGQRLEAIDGVAAATPVRYLEVECVKPDGGDETLALMAVDPASYRRVTSFVFAANQGDADQLFARLSGGEAVFISTVLSEKYGLGQGDSIRLKTRRGEKDFEIAAVVVDFYNQGMIVEASWGDMRRYFGVDNVSVFLVKLEPGPTAEQVKSRIDRVYGTRRHLTIESNEAIKSRALNLTGQAFTLFDVVALIGIIVASLGVVNTLAMNVLERIKEIGMLRGVGMTRGQVAKMILAEAGMIGIIGGVFGLGFGLFLSRLFITSAGTLQGYNLTYVVPREGILIALFVSLLLSQLAALWPATQAARVNVIEAVQFE